MQNLPQSKQVGDVTLDDFPLMIVPGSYKLGPADRFADQISTGALRYEDFRPYETPWEVTSLAGGYGLQRYSDREPGDISRRMMYAEAENVDCRDDGMVILGPYITQSDTALTGTPLWIGEFTPSGGSNTLVVVTDDGKVYSVNTDMTLTLKITLPAAPQRGAIGVMGSNLIIGYGATRTAQYTADLSTLADVTNSTPLALYVWALTVDRAASYVAGGPAVTDWYKVVSSTTGIAGYSTDANSIKCGNPADKIVELAPGGGVVIVFVGMENGLGSIDSSGVYRTLVPFDSRLSTNCEWMRWWLSLDGDEQRGPVVLFFPREQGLWSYQPSSETAGTAKNMSPWAATGIRPPNIRGRPVSLQGSARWLYYTVYNANQGKYWIDIQDARTGSVHSTIALDINQCKAMGISSLLSTTPYLYIGYGNRLARIRLPLDGDSPLDNAGYLFAYTGTLDLPACDYEFPDEEKILRRIRLIADNLIPGITEIAVSYSLDGGAWISLGAATDSPVVELEFPENTTCKRVQFRLTFSTVLNTITPQLRAFVIRARVNPRMFRIWEFQAYLPAGSYASMTDDLLDPKVTAATLWEAYEEGFDIPWMDVWGDTWEVNILGIAEQQVVKEPDRTPEHGLALQLLEVRRTGGGSVYDDPASVYDLVTTTYGG